MTVPDVHRRRFKRAPAEKRARIIAVARGCFTEQAYEDTTTGEIARRAGVSEGTIFHHFGTKRGLLVAVAEDYALDMARSILGGLEEFDPPAIPEIFCRGVAFRQKQGALGLDARGSRMREPVEIVREAVREALIAEGAKLADAWQERALIRPMNSRLFCETMYPVFDQLLLTSFIDGADSLSDAWLREISACFAGALGRTPIPDALQ